MLLIIEQVSSNRVSNFSLEYYWGRPVLTAEGKVGVSMSCVG